MSKLENSIGWCDATINAVTGCDKVSPGCKNCYAAVGTRARVLRGQGIETWGPKGVRHPVNFEPVFRRLNKLMICDKCHTAHSRDADLTFPCAECGGTHRRIRLFADSNSDWLDPRWLIVGRVDMLGEFLRSIFKAPNIDTLVLTKRIENFFPRLTAVRDHYAKAPSVNDAFCVWLDNWLQGDPPKHVWVGVSVEDQKRADERIPLLRQTPAAVRFLSVEPLLEPVHFAKVPGFNKAGSTGQDLLRNFWVIVGLESGKDRRDGGVESLISVHDQCVAAGVPVYVKQDCAFKSGQQGRIPDHVWARKEFPR